MSTKQFLPFLFIALAIACDDETITEPQTPIRTTSTVQFQSAELVAAENILEYVIKLPLNRKPIKAGEVVIDITTDNKKEFQISPAPVNGKITLPVTPNSDFLQLTVALKDNAIIDGDGTLNFTIVQASEGIVAGEKKSLKLIITDNDIPSTATFSIDKAATRENNTDGIDVVINLSAAAPADGLLKLSAQSSQLVYGRDYTTEPALVNNVLTLPVNTGNHNVSFKLFPTDDTRYNGDRELSFALTHAEGGVSRNNNSSAHAITITDDELAGRARGYTIGGSLWSLKREYVYNENGKLGAIHWEQNTPETLKGTDEYIYNNEGKVIRITKHAYEYELFIWEGDRIIKKERYREDALREYTLYGYDQAGNVAEVSQYYKQQDGSFPLVSVFVYLYHTDGNIYKSLAYWPDPDSHNLVLISTKTYENYLNIDNPFITVDILPNINSQPKLPLTYKEEREGIERVYTFTYEFDGHGKPTKRIARWASGSESVNYYYYN